MNNYLSAPNWQNKRPFFKNLAPNFLQDWLDNRESLTHALICACPHRFSVRILSEGWQKPTRSESNALHIPLNSFAFVRQVHLYCGDQAWVYARTIIPKNTLHGEFQKLTHLGTQPLGAILFANKHIQRGDIEIAKITHKQKIYRSALMFSKNETKNIWGRRSIFKIANKPLMVSEFFLPELPRSCK